MKTTGNLAALTTTALLAGKTGESFVLSPKPFPIKLSPITEGQTQRFPSNPIELMRSADRKARSIILAEVFLSQDPLINLYFASTGSNGPENREPESDQSPESKSQKGVQGPSGPDDPDDPDDPEDNNKKKDKPESQSKLFGLDKVGNKVRSMLKDTKDGNEMHLEIDDHLHDCYPFCPLDEMKYTVNHDDFSGRRKLRIDKEFLDTDDTLYHRLMRDTVYAEWSTDENQKESLHIKMHVTGNSEGVGPLWELWVRQSDLPESVKDEIIHIGGELRKKIFQSHEEDAIEVIFTVIRDTLHDNPELLESEMFIHYLSDMESLQEVEDLGTIGEWLKIVEEHERSGVHDGADPISKNLEVWGGSMVAMKNALGRVVNDVLPKLIQEHPVLSRIFQQTTVVDMVVLMIMILHDKMRKP